MSTYEESARPQHAHNACEEGQHLALGEMMKALARSSSGVSICTFFISKASELSTWFIVTRSTEASGMLAGSSGLAYEKGTYVPTAEVLSLLALQVQKYKYGRTSGQQRLGV